MKSKPAEAAQKAAKGTTDLIDYITGGNYEFEGIDIRVLQSDNKGAFYRLRKEAVTSLLETFAQSIIDQVLGLLNPIQTIMPSEPKPEYGPSPIPQLLINTQMLNVLEKKIMAAMEEKIMAAVASIQMSNGQEIDPKDYNKHLFGKSP